jgi:hypothetical protein
VAFALAKVGRGPRSGVTDSPIDAAKPSRVARLPLIPVANAHHSSEAPGPHH